jgi:hypothetical protein
LVVNGGRGTGEVVDLVDFDVEREGHVVPDELEVRLAQKVRDVVLGPGEEIVDTQDVVTSGDQALAQVRAEKTGSSGHQDSLSQAVCPHR